MKLSTEQDRTRYKAFVDAQPDRWAKRRVPLDQRIQESSVPVPESGCWLWVGGTSVSGYGQMSLNGVTRRAHRLSYQVFVGPIPAGMMVCHKCDTPLCVNPNHLFVGTGSDNARDRHRKGRARDIRGEKSHNAKLTREQVASIRADNRQRKVVAKEYGVSPPRSR